MIEKEKKEKKLDMKLSVSIDTSNLIIATYLSKILFSLIGKSK